jgi:serine/threonine-protein kinase RsbW
MNLSFILANDVSELRRLFATLAPFSRAIGLGTETVGEIRLALEEVISNICRYGYPENCPGRLEVAFRLAGGALRIEIRDDGRPFNPLAEAPEPDLSRPFEEREIGGLGVFLVRRLMDRVNYGFEDGRNVFTMEKDCGEIARALHPPEGEPMPLRISAHEKQPGVMVVSPAGALDTQTYQMLDERLAAILESRPRLLVLDMEFVDYVSSIGISTILKARKAIQKTGGRMTLMHLQPQVRKVFEIINALPSQPIFSSTAELDAYLDRMQRGGEEGGEPPP